MSEAPDVNSRHAINPLRLETEWEDHPQMVYNASKRVAMAVKLNDEATDLLTLLKAEVEKKVRDSPGTFGIDKVTENAITAAVNSHPDILLAKKRVINTRHEKGVAEADVLALEHRKRALSKLTDLWLHEYYSDQRASTGTVPGGSVQNRAWRRYNEQKQEEDSEDVKEDTGVE